MDELQLNRDEHALFVRIPCDGDPVGNTVTRTALGWSKVRYGRARQGLLDKELVLRARGRGGALKRAPVTKDADVEADHTARFATVRPPLAEADLYGPILSTLRDEWAEDRGFQPLAIEETARQGKRRTGGARTRPDLVAIGLKTFRHVPHKQFEIFTFEVKSMQQVNLIAVFEALAHRRASTHAYILVEIRTELTDVYKEALDTATATAHEHGIGAITFDDPADYETWEEVLPAQRFDSPPEAMNEFIEAQISRQGQTSIATAIAAMRGERRRSASVGESRG